MRVVERTGARRVILRSQNDVTVLFSSTQPLDAHVINWNHEHPGSRLHLLHLMVGVDYGTNSKIIRSVLLQSAREHSQVLAEPKPQVYLHRFGNNTTEFNLMVWIRQPECQLAICSDLCFRIEELLRQQDISIAFPHQDSLVT